MSGIHGDKEQIAKGHQRVAIWKVVVGILFFPITIVIIIIRSPKMNFGTKMILIVLSMALIGGISSSNSLKTDGPDENDEMIQESNTEEDMQAEITQQDTGEVYVEDVEYHKNKRINSLLNAYNEICEYPILEDMVKKGAYDFSANLICNEVGIMIYASGKNKMFVDYSYEGTDDAVIKPIFRDFCIAMNPCVTEEVVEQAWTSLQTGQYQNYTYYVFDGIECTYSEQKLVNGEYRYTIKTRKKQ